MPWFQVRIKYSTIRTYTVEAKDAKEAEDAGKVYSFHYWGASRYLKQDKTRVLKVTEDKQKEQTK